MFVLRFKHIHFYKTGRGEPRVSCHVRAPHATPTQPRATYLYSWAHAHVSQAYSQVSRAPTSCWVESGVPIIGELHHAIKERATSLAAHI